MAKEVRFLVIDENGRRSGDWKLCVQGDEAYLMQRNILSKHVKFSFHKSGECRWAEINKQKTGTERALQVWMRPPIKEIESGKLIRIADLGFPTNHLNADSSSIEEKLIKLKSAPPSQATMVSVCLSSSPVEEIMELAGPVANLNIFFSKPLRSGGYVHGLSSYFECGEVELNVPGRPDVKETVFGEMEFPNDPMITKRPIRMGVLSKDPISPCMWELGGYETITKAELLRS